MPHLRRCVTNEALRPRHTRQPKPCSPSSSCLGQAGWPVRQPASGMLSHLRMCGSNRGPPPHAHARAQAPPVAAATPFARRPAGLAAIDEAMMPHLRRCGIIASSFTVARRGGVHSRAWPRGPARRREVGSSVSSVGDGCSSAGRRDRASPLAATCGPPEHRDTLDGWADDRGPEALRLRARARGRRRERATMLSRPLWGTSSRVG